MGYIHIALSAMKKDVAERRKTEKRKREKKKKKKGRG
jgi:hypothetical protein